MNIWPTPEHTANTITTLLCGIPCLLTASLKKILLKGKHCWEVWTVFKEKKMHNIEWTTTKDQSSDQSCWAPHSIKPHLLYTLHSPIASLLIFVCPLCRDRPVSLCNTQKCHCVPTTEPQFRCLMLPCFHYFSPLLFTLIPNPSRRLSVLELNNAAQCLHSNEETTQTEGESQRGLNSLNETNAIYKAKSTMILMQSI